MSFHQHCFPDCLLIYGQCHLYGYNSLSKRQNLIDAHADVRFLQQVFQFLIDIEARWNLSFFYAIIPEILSNFAGNN